MPYMTCKQHLIFFAKLRGLTHREAAILTNKLLQQLNLSKKAHNYGKNLSGGMKRRLSLGIAMAGDTNLHTTFTSFCLRVRSIRRLTMRRQMLVRFLFWMIKLVN
ncbi:ABC transporter A family member 1-like [Glossina fuscipes]|uniref:ABC transporter A family member 1-like n=1 Tax=Glossina fuscipes TaxID=7396 RepID=A0A9C6DP89_9MUSC|nr:ABC transporter A family member 1-like [Glossina fuscipes]KAI9576556.1 hypothetical protein GQX74_009613 [Glossina fuscipes]